MVWLYDFIAYNQSHVFYAYHLYCFSEFCCFGALVYMIVDLLNAVLISNVVEIH